MAVDTRNKRGSAIGFMLPGRVVYPNPSGSLSAVALREQIAYSYAGITPATSTLTPDGRSAAGVDMGSRSTTGVAMGTRTASGANLGSRSVAGRGPN